MTTTRFILIGQAGTDWWYYMQDWMTAVFYNSVTTPFETTGGTIVATCVGIFASFLIIRIGLKWIRSSMKDSVSE